MAQALFILLLMPLSTGMLLLGGLATARGQWVSGLFLLVVGVFATLFCVSLIVTSMRAAKPSTDMLVLTPKTFYDCRIMKHPVAWSKLDWELCPYTGRVFLKVDPRYEGHMHRALPDRLMGFLHRRLGRFDYVVRNAFTGLPRGVLAHEMLNHRRPTGSHSFRGAPAE